MKLSSLMLLTVFFGLLTSCNDKGEVVEPKGYFNPLTCTQKSSSECGVDWILSLNKLNLPANAQILINEKVIIDECDPKSYWFVSGETASQVEFRISNYSNLDGAHKFSLRIFDRKDCSLTKTEKSFEADQGYTIKSVGGKKEIWVIR